MLNGNCGKEAKTSETVILIHRKICALAGSTPTLDIDEDCNGQWNNFTNRIHSCKGTTYHCGSWIGSYTNSSVVFKVEQGVMKGTCCYNGSGGGAGNLCSRYINTVTYK